MRNFYNSQSFSFAVIISEEKQLKPNSPLNDISWNLKEDWRFDPSFWRVWIILNGSGHVVSTTGEFDVNANEIYLMPPNSIVSTSLYEPMTQYYIDFMQNPKEISIDQLYTFKKTAKKEDFDLIYSLAKSIYHLYDNPDEASSLTVSATITTILTRFIDFLSENHDKFKKVLKYISQNYTQSISLTYLANLCDYSPEYFSTKFKEMFGLSPQKYIIHKRLTQAKFLLISTNRTIREIGSEVGYPDQVHFSKIFKKEVGYSPIDYRKNYQHESTKKQK